MRIGSTEVKNCAAMVMERSNMSTRTKVAALRSTMRPGQWESSHPTGPRSRGGSLASVSGCDGLLRPVDHGKPSGSCRCEDITHSIRVVLVRWLGDSCARRRSALRLVRLVVGSGRA